MKIIKFKDFINENKNLDNRMHNGIVGDIYYYLRTQFESKNDNKLMIFQNVRIEEDLDKSIKPNILIEYDGKIITIEVFSGNITDVIKKYSNQMGDISEMFFYDYKKKKWYDLSTKENSLSKILQIDLSETIK